MPPSLHPLIDRLRALDHDLSVLLLKCCMMSSDGIKREKSECSLGRMQLIEFGSREDRLEATLGTGKG